MHICSHCKKEFKWNEEAAGRLDDPTSIQISCNNKGVYQ